MQKKKQPEIIKIVLTGGPCAGKTTAMSWIHKAFGEMSGKYTVLFVPEAATELITSGVTPKTCASNLDFQKCVARLQKELEGVYEQAARSMKTDRVLIVCDRGVLDGKVYLEPGEFEDMLESLETNEVKERDQYDGIFHMVTAAKGARDAYTLSNNAARREAPHEAVELDDKLIAAWTGHPHLRVIDNSTDFEKKMKKLIAEITALLGDPEPLEIERKYLIGMPDTEALEGNPNCEKIEIIQTYLNSPDGTEIRVRQRGQNGHFMFFRTEKKRISDVSRAEAERRITPEEYLSALMDADPARHPIRKTRFCLTENNRYYEIDIYPEWSKQAVMELELKSEDEEVPFPEGIRVIREITNEPAYTNFEMAKKMPEESNEQ